MKRMKAGKCFAFAAWVVVSLLASSAAAIDEFTWNSALVGSQSWQVDGNWSPPTFPNSGDVAAIVAVGSDLTLDLGPTDVAVAVLTLNGTSSGTDINVSSGGGRLVFQNDDDNTSVNPAPANVDVEEILVHEGVNLGRVYVTSNGAAGSTNTISAPIRLANNGFLEGVDFVGTNSITLSGAIDVVGTTADDSGSLRSYLPTGSKLHVTGPINLTDAGDSTTARFLVLNNYYTSDHGEPPRGIIEIDGAISGAGGLVVGWTWDVDGVEDGTDDTLYDPAPTPALPFGSVILAGNSTFTGDVVQARGNLVIGHDNALGADNTLIQGGPAGNSKEVGYNIISTSDDRNVANNVNVSQWMTVKGAASVPGLESIGDHSIEFSGQALTTNSRGWVNLLPAGKTLTLSGPQYALEDDNGNDPFRFQTFDGTGRTMITGGIHNRQPGEMSLPGGLGYFRKRGTGTVVVDFDESNTLDTPSDYVGETFVEGGNLHFATESDLPDPSTVGVNSPHLAEVHSTGGAIGLDAGVLASTTFKDMLNSSANPNVSGQLAPFNPPYFLDLPNSFPIGVTYDSGGLMLAANEYGSVGVPQSLNFSVGGNLERAANMTLAAWESGSTFRGTITPSSTVPVNPNTYQLGGGGGTLTLPDNNQLTGGRALLVTNGGEVKLDGTHDYTGKTRVTGKFHTSLQEHAAVGTADTDGDGDYAEEATNIFVGSALTVSSLADAGSNSGIGNFASSSDATGLLIQGSTLKYVGGATSTNRLFTVGTMGATIDSSGTGALTFSNAAALGIDVAENRTGIASLGGVPGNDNDEVFGVPLFSSGGQPVQFSTEDLVPGMRVRDVVTSSAQLESDLVIDVITAPHAIQVEEEIVDEGETPWGGVGNTVVRTFEFGPAPARRLTLGGSNSGDNLLMPLVADAADRDKVFAPRGSIVEESSGPLGGPGGNGSVGIEKTGTGKWILAANNTYTGATDVEGGTLLVNGTQTGTGLTTVSGGASFGGTGQIGGGLTMLEGSIFTAAFAGGTIDPLNVLGNVDLTALANSLAITGSGVGSSWTLLTYAGLLTGTFESTPGYTVDYGSGSNSQITITATAGLIGDYNGNGTVDAADYTVWRNNLGGAGATLGANRDPDNGSGVVNTDDYNSWKANFGAMAGAGGGGIGGGAVPEPASLVLVGIALAAAGCIRQRVV